MASYGGATMQSDVVRATIAEAKQLTVEKLKRVLKQENLQVSGIKNELQTRLIAHIENAARSGDQERLNRIRHAVRVTTSYGYAGIHNPYPSPYSNTNHTPSSSASPQFNNSPTPRLPPPNGHPNMQLPSFPQTLDRMSFKKSPFYTILKPLSSVVELKVREHARDGARTTVNLDESLARQLALDPMARIMVFCTAESFDYVVRPVEISFPQHGELKCNQDDVKANLKGLKNRPGSTKPADVTHLIRKKANFPNVIELIYALTNKKFYFVVNLVQKRSIESLVSELKTGRFRSKERVMQEMRNAAADPDIVATSSVMSLKDPVQMTRIQTPCKSQLCKHSECFDGAVYLALQEQAPTWTCPVCSKPAHWEQLIFDQYVDDILQNTGPGVEQVTIDPDGRWYVGSQAGANSRAGSQDTKQSTNGHDEDDDDDYDYDDDLVEITDPQSPVRSMSGNLHGFSRTPSVVRTPVMSSRDLGSFTAPSTSQGKSNKRPREEVIDLTLSDEDDDLPTQPPVSRIKRPSLSSQASDMTRLRVTDAFNFRIPPVRPASSHPNDFFDHFTPRL